MRRLAAAALSLVAFSWGQVYKPGPQVLTFFSEVDDSDQPYGVYIPPKFDGARKYPLVVSLHGAFSNHRLNLRRLFGKGNLRGETDAEATRYFPPLPEVDFIVATPFARGTMGYQGIAERDVYDVLADVKRRFPIDEDRVYLTGLSMGGGGTLWLGFTRPDVWAAIAAVCPAPPPGTEEFAGNALNFPVHLFQGEIDPLVPASAVRLWHKRLLDLDTRVEYIEYPGVRHNSWEMAYRDAAIFEWFAQFRRNPHPARVRFTTDRYKYDSAYWVTIDGLDPGTPAAIDVRFTAKNQVAITTLGSLAGFTLNLAGHPMFAARQPVSVTIDGTAVRIARARDAVSFTRGSTRWQTRRYAPPAGWKRPGAEGPAAEVISGRHAYVYGTAGSPGEGELARRRTQAAAAAEWSTPRLNLLLSHRVLADEDVTEADLRRGSAVLFGTRETNKLIERYASNAPIELNPGAADYGLVLVVPIFGRTAIINSGLPWWTGMERAKRQGLSFLSGPHIALQSFGDFILFRGSLENVVAEGRFGSNWRLSEDSAAKLRETGAVTLR